MRSAGILMPITSLPSDYGVGTMGKEAYDFVDFLVKAKQSYWQILPICPTGYGDSPYQSFSTFAGNPYWIDLDLLNEEGYLEKEEYVSIDFGNDEEKVNYGLLYENRFDVLKKAVFRMVDNEWEDFEKFCRKNEDWLEDYALFMVLKNRYHGKAWLNWPKALRNREQASLDKIWDKENSNILFYQGVQYLFFKQFKNLKEYANKNGIKIIGDLPIYVALDSSDVWSNPSLFVLDENLKPVEVAGCPPDAFTEDGQLWGNPLYRWDEMKKDNYSWWIKRVSYLENVYDVLRLDHFRGFESYYAIPFGNKNAKIGRWIKGPGLDFINEIKKNVSGLEIIAEDLGYLDQAVIDMLNGSGFAGMKVVEFGFDGEGFDSGYLPHNFPVHCVAYLGTHDNDTFVGWYNSLDKKIKQKAKDYLRLSGKDYYFEACCYLWSTVSELTIVQLQDILGLDSSARINEPSTLGKNWLWRLKKNVLNDSLAKKIAKEMVVYDRERK